MTKNIFGGLVKRLIIPILIIPLLLTSCKDYPIKLPNGYIASGKKIESKAHKGSYNIRSYERDLVRKSRLNGTISYIGFLKTEDNVISVNNINQKNRAGDGGILSAGGDSKNNVTIFDYGGIIMKIKPLNLKIDEYLMQIKTHENRISPIIALEKFDEGDTISIPTIRKYDYSSWWKSYRILNEIDYLYLHEIEDKKER
ncbi:MAG: hypothetical protein KJ566_03105 [Nanoarchaeota archaeon]|nr:hypothetical protein [Nanoarchaeota archaeon]